MTSVSTTAFDYEYDGLDLEGVLVPGEDASAPTVLVFHGMEGRSDAQVEFCHRLAATGYRTVAVDLFGRDVTRDVARSGMDAGAATMTALLQDRDTLRDRLFGVVDVITALPEVDPDAMAAIGFCFGGLCMLDLARHGTHLKAVGSFHGLLTPPPRTPDAPIATRVAVYHGWDDPFAPPADVVALGAELTARGADWQLGLRPCDARVHGALRQRPRARHSVRRDHGATRVGQPGRHAGGDFQPLVGHG